MSTFVMTNDLDVVAVGGWLTKDEAIVTAADTAVKWT